MSGELVVEHEIKNLLQVHARPLSARRVNALLNAKGEEIKLSEVVKSLKSLTETGAVEEKRRGIYAWISTHEVSSSKSTSAPLDDLKTEGSTELQDASPKERLKGMKQERRRERKRETEESTSTAPNTARESRSKKSTSTQIKGALRRVKGVSFKGAQPLRKVDLEEARQLIGFLRPYPASPVEVNDVIEAERILGRPELYKRLWSHLEEEMSTLAQLYKVSLRSDDPSMEAAPQAETNDVRHRPSEMPLKADVQERVTEEAEETAEAEYEDEDEDEDEHEDEDEDEDEHEDEDEDEHEHEDEDEDEHEDEDEDEDEDEPSARAISILNIDHKSISLEELTRKIISAPPNVRSSVSPTEQLEVRRALASSNTLAQAQGNRPPFTFDFNGEIGLSAWGCSPGMIVADERMNAEFKAYRHALNEHLVDLVRTLPSEGFEALLRSLLQHMGYHGIDLLNGTEDGRVILIAHHREGEATVLIAQRHAQPLTSKHLSQIQRGLTGLYADRGIVVHLSGFEKVTPPEGLRLIDGPRLVDLMCTHNVGVQGYTHDLYFADQVFFQGLKERSDLC